MSKKKKCKCKDKEEAEVYFPLYVQSSNPDQILLDWMAEMGETRIVYFQSGKPPGCGTPGNPCGGG